MFAGGETMNVKRKLIIIAVCIVIVIAVLTANVVRRIKSGEDHKTDEDIVKENVITRAEAYRLLSFLEYDKAGREALRMEINYADKNMSDWYDTYVNAVCKMGLIEGNITASPNEALTLGQGKALIDKLITKNPYLQGVYTGLSFDFLKADEEMLIPQFLELYKALLEMIPEDKRLIKEDILFVLDREISENGKDRIVTDLGRYYYQDSRDYEKFFGQESDRSYIRLSGEDFINRFNNKGIEVLTCGDEIIYISKIHQDKIVLHNVWIKQGRNMEVAAYINGVHKELKTQFKLSQEVESVVGDISIQNEKIIAISVKPDRIQGKVLLSGEDFIEIEGYGRIPLEENYKIYKIYGELSMERTNGILVGYDTTDFVVSGGRISAALIRESIKAENIRVLIHTTGFKDIYHEKVEFGGTSDFVIRVGEDETTYTADETITLTSGDSMLSAGRVIIEPASEKGKIKLLSVERSSGVPKYRGRIEIAQGDKGLLVVNELPLEEYLYAVIPSEMPTYYGLEPLKVQAVCARSYAYRHLMANSLSSFGAHVDDSVSYQVYNNIAENEDSILAVKDTYGKVVEYDGEIITAYYFSTSCGHTSSVEHVWANGTATPYLSGRLLYVEEDDSKDVMSEQKKLYSDLTKEDNFRSFILDQKFDTYDSEYSWYRWYVTIEAKDIESNIKEKLAGRYRANPELIKTLVSGNPLDKDAVYESLPVETVGKIEGIFVKSRGTGGIIYELIIQGSERTIKVQTEYNIRVLLSPSKDTVYRQDEKGIEDLSLLPSAFFFIDKNMESGKLESFSITGGGYGHGVGMSQNGVKSLSDAGKKYEDIIKYFYRGTDIGFIYE
jgi:stage II sporulation protein D